MGNEKHHSMYNIERQNTNFEAKKSWLPKLSCHGNVNIDVDAMTTLDIFFSFFFHTYSLSITVLTMWMVHLKMLYKSYRI